MVGDCLKNTCLSAETNAQRIFMRPSAGWFVQRRQRNVQKSVLCQMQANSGAEFLPVSLTQKVEHKLIEH